MQRILSKRDVVRKIRQETGLKLVDINSVVNSMIHVIEESLENGDSVQLYGFGTFKIREMQQRLGRNINTGEVVRIPAKAVPAFEPGHRLKMVSVKKL